MLSFCFHRSVFLSFATSKFRSKFFYFFRDRRRALLDLRAAPPLGSTFAYSCGTLPAAGALLCVCLHLVQLSLYITIYRADSKRYPPKVSKLSTKRKKQKPISFCLNIERALALSKCPLLFSIYFCFSVSISSMVSRITVPSLVVIVRSAPQ